MLLVAADAEPLAQPPDADALVLDLADLDDARHTETLQRWSARAAARLALPDRWWARCSPWFRGVLHEELTTIARLPARPEGLLLADCRSAAQARAFVSLLGDCFGERRPAAAVALATPAAAAVAHEVGAVGGLAALVLDSEALAATALVPYRDGGLVVHARLSVAFAAAARALLCWEGPLTGPDSAELGALAAAGVRGALTSSPAALGHVRRALAPPADPRPGAAPEAEALWRAWSGEPPTGP